MQRLLLRSAALAAVLTISASAAFAQGSLNMAWTNCVGEGTPVTNMAFACNITTGSHTLVCSFIPGAAVPLFNGAEEYIDVITTTSPLPAWWAMSTMGNGGTQCRSGLSANFTINGSYVVCLDAWGGSGAGGVSAYANPIVALPGNGSATNIVTIDVAGAVPTGSEQALASGTEYFLANVLINNTKSTGTGSCAGCTDPACLSFTRLSVTQPTGTPLYYSTPGVNSLVTWQGAGANCSAVPVRKSTWGSIKGMYR